MKGQSNMALLKRKIDPVAEAEKEVAALTSRGAQLKHKLAEANAALESASDIRRVAMLDADLDDMTAAQTRDAVVRDARERVETLTEALHSISTMHSNAQSKLVAARDAHDRQELASTVRARADELHTAAVALKQAGATAITAMEAVLALVPGLSVEFGPQVRALVSTSCPKRWTD
jgi:hypothetical protein